jgi:GH25 family lysozyme M1 (1,4-beta-N-acetylmuramidase)
MSFFGIDVSKYQGTINWEKLKSKIGFAIIRCGFGGDFAFQDDSKFLRNVTECERLKIPFGVYLYSYAKNENMIDSEVAHTLRLIGEHKPFCVFLDMEDNSTVDVGKQKLTLLAKRYCEAVKEKGFRVGVYANQNWFRNYLNVKALREAGYAIWCAKYSDEKPKIDAEYDIWQYSSTGTMEGISGKVDMNEMVNDIRHTEKRKKTVDELAAEVWQGLWGNGEERRKRLLAEGYDPDAVQKRVNELAAKPVKKTVDEIARDVIKGLYGNGAERKKKLAAEGYDPAAVQKRVNELLKK